jgi:hypothetical protein
MGRQVYAYGNVTYLGNGDLGTASNPSTPITPLTADSSTVPCAAGTTDLGLTTGHSSGTAVTIRLCAVSNLSSSGSESNAGNSYSIRGANGRAIVNSRVSGAVYTLVQAAKASGLTVSAISSFRTYQHQVDLYTCYINHKKGCKLAAKPGYSNHELGLAVDFDGLAAGSASGCSFSVSPTPKLWTWLRAHALTYGYRQLAAEHWHWDPTTGSQTMC